MTDLVMPTFDDAVAMLKTMEPDYVMDHNGRRFVSYRALSFALFEKGSPAWKRPVGQPHGLDESPVMKFMSGLRFSGKVKTINRSQTYFEIPDET